MDVPHGVPGAALSVGLSRLAPNGGRRAVLIGPRCSGHHTARGKQSPGGGAVVRTEDVFRVGRYALRLEHLQGLAVRGDNHLREDIAGIVVTDGADTTEVPDSDGSVHIEATPCRRPRLALRSVDLDFVRVG